MQYLKYLQIAVYISIYILEAYRGKILVKHVLQVLKWLKLSNSCYDITGENFRNSRSPISENH